MGTKIEMRVTGYLVARIFREDDLFVAECLVLPVVSQGETESEAMANLIEATEMFLEEAVRRGKLETILRKYHWTPSVHPPREIPEGAFALPVPFLPAIAQQAAEWRG